MSLATRCTACGTVFRVVQDQLKVSDGWVRCGRCDAVFNAAEGLFDLEREAPPSWSPTQPPAEAPRAVADPAVAESPERFAEDREEAFHAEPSGFGAAAFAAPSATPSDLIAAALARHADDIAAFRVPAAAPERGSEPSAGATAVDGGGGRSTSAFAWRPDADRGRRPTAWLAGAAVLLVLALAAQAAAQFSEVAAARWPAFRPVLARWCGVAGCSLAAPRRIEALVVDSSALAPVTGTDALKLGIALRNRASFAVAVPSVDLSLTDSAGRLLARRTLDPADFRVAAALLGPGGELPLQALLTAAPAPVTGYTVEIFYP